MDIDKSIETVLEGIPVGYYFDSHLVFDQLNEHHSEVYNSFVDNFCNEDTPKRDKRLPAHQQIGHKIKDCDDLVERQEGSQAWSKNIHGQVSECALWRKK